MKTDDPNYYHKIVDCQWACPAHTNVPEYIRLIADKRYSEAYLLNRKSNVFPGILGRVCDRPCEPACRRGRLQNEKPVAICRLKRVAADYKQDISQYLPPVPPKKNGKKVALIGAGPASLTVANDLLPLGYDLTLFEKETLAGGAMRASVPLFRLPKKVLDEEIGYIIDRGVKAVFNHPVKSLKTLADEYDAVFVGSGAPLGRDLVLPGRKEGAAGIFVGLDWLASIAFEHTSKIGKEVIVIGGGNTAMDCCRSALRLGAKNVNVIAPEAFSEMLASEWEKEDAVEEGVKFKNNLLPEKYEVKDGKLVGIWFQPLIRCYDEKKHWNPIKDESKGLEFVPCDAVVLAIGQNTAFPFIERDMGVEFSKNDRPIVDTTTMGCSHPKVFFGGDAAFGPKNIIWAVAHGHEAALSIHLALSGKDVKARPPQSMQLVSQKMGIHEWSYDNDIAAYNRTSMPHVALGERFQKIEKEVELGFDEKLAFKEAERCLNCDVQTVFTEKQCIECDACIDICPVDCLSITANGDEGDIVKRINAPYLNKEQHLYVSQPLKDTARVMVKDENLCLHCGLCAERCPTGAWDMQKFALNLPQAVNSNG
ncbi:MAG: FAD-dependent oxidoreductase [Oligoflexales bacterium]